MKNYLNFETEIKDLETELDKLKDPYNQSGLSEVDTKKISQTQSELDEKLKEVYANLDPWQTTMVARHEDRPKSKFFVDNFLSINVVSSEIPPYSAKYNFESEEISISGIREFYKTENGFEMRFKASNLFASLFFLSKFEIKNSEVISES